MANNYFKFKQFNISQDKCGMKVGTDGVMLGAWAAVPQSGEVLRILDIGCGTGILSLMVAQRSSAAIIDGVDMVADAVEQATDNILETEWSSRISIYNSKIQDYNPTCKYDFIISNPPYFINSLKADDGAERMAARHADTLPYNELAQAVNRLLTDKGTFSVIFPYVEANLFIAMAVGYGLFCVKRLDVKGAPNKPVKRVLLQFKREREELQSEEMTIENGERHDYSDRYKELTKDFYLKF